MRPNRGRTVGPISKTGGNSGFRISGRQCPLPTIRKLRDPRWPHGVRRFIKKPLTCINRDKGAEVMIAVHLRNSALSLQRAGWSAWPPVPT